MYVNAPVIRYGLDVRNFDYTVSKYRCPNVRPLMPPCPDYGTIRFRVQIGRVGGSSAVIITDAIALSKSIETVRGDLWG